MRQTGDTHSRDARRINDSLVTGLYNLQKKYYLNDGKFQDELRKAQVIAKYFNQYYSTADLFLKLKTKMTYEDFVSSLKGIGAATLKTGNIDEASIKQKLEIISSYKDKLNDLIYDMNILKNAFADTSLKNSKFATELSKSLESLSKNINNNNFTGKDLDTFLKNFAGGVSNLLGESLEFSVSNFIDSSLKNDILQDAFTGNHFRITDVRMTGQAKIKGRGGLTARGAISNRATTSVRDVEVDINDDGKKSTIGISIKNYTLQQDRNQVEYANVKLRTSNFGVLLNRLMGFAPIETQGFYEILTTRKVPSGIVGAFHTYKYTTGAPTDEIGNEIMGIETIINNLREIFGLMMYDEMLSQGNFRKRGIQLVFLTKKMMTWNEVFPSNPHKLKVSGLMSPRLYEISTGRNEQPSYDSDVDIFRYLLRYRSLSLILNEQIMLTKALGK